MSSLFVRNTVRQWLGAYAPVSYYDTINQEQSPSDNIWMSCEFFATSKDGLLGCGGYMERGIIDLIFMSQPGLGDVPLLTALEPAVAAFMANEDPTHALTLENTETVREVSGGSADRFYRLGVGVEYSYSVG